MTFIRDISNHVRSLGQKLSASNIHKLGQKAMNTAHAIGRKACNTLRKTSNCRLDAWISRAWRSTSICI